MKLSALLSFLPGCSKEPPKAPGVSAQLRFPVLVAGERRLLVKDDLESLTTTTTATGINHLVCTLLDSGGARYTVRSVTDFDRKNAFLDMGTSRYRIFLDLKAGGTASLDEAKAIVKETALSSRSIENPQAAVKIIDSAGSIPQLIELTRRSWEWR